MIDMPSKIVTIWHNLATDLHGNPVGMRDGYRDGHPLTPVAVYRRFDMHDDRICSEAFRIFNIGEESHQPCAHAIAYRQRGNRSLSVGDVIQIGDRPSNHNELTVDPNDRWFSIEPFGFEDRAWPLYFAVGASRHGSTSLQRLMPRRAERRT